MKKTKSRKEVLTPVLIQDHVASNGKYCNKKCSHLEFCQVANSVFFCTLSGQHLKGHQKVIRCESCIWAEEQWKKVYSLKD